jgi:IS30 family transposase
VTDDDVERMRRMHHSGMSIRAIARGVGRNRTTVRRYLGADGTVAQPVSEQEERTMRRLAARGFTHRQISAATGRSEGTVSRYLRHRYAHDDAPSAS